MFYKLKTKGATEGRAFCVFLNYNFKSAIASSTVFVEGSFETVAILGAAPSGSLIFKFTLELFFIPTTLKRVLIAFAVLPDLPITFPMSALSTTRVSNTPISSTVLVIFTFSGTSTKALTTSSKNFVSFSCIVFNCNSDFAICSNSTGK